MELNFWVLAPTPIYEKLTFVMCCQTVAKKSIAPSSDDFRPRQAYEQDQEFEEKKF